VRCNLVAPGVILTKAALKATTEEYRTEILASVRSPRLGAPEDLAAMVAFLFSDDGAYVNGQTILVDGGANLTWRLDRGDPLWLCLITSRSAGRACASVRFVSAR
jgi:NAD(P)-dependent dehydrogenase (short-subunit alcohol dehydrogenase family)